jgi:hypothetical protein
MTFPAGSLVARRDPGVLKVALFSAVAAAGVALLNALGIVVQNRLGLGKTPEYTPAVPTKPVGSHR